jgi:hypothetical protein
MLGVFGVNVYIDLYDTNLTQISPVHTELNWVIAAADVLAAIFLFVKPGNLIFKSLGGIVWPIFYIANLFIDVETRLCLGAAETTCSATVSDAYQYLILGSADQEWVLWPYTIRFAIGLVISVLILSLVSFRFRPPKEKKSQQTIPQDKQVQSGTDSK